MAKAINENFIFWQVKRTNRNLLVLNGLSLAGCLWLVVVWFLPLCRLMAGGARLSDELIAAIAILAPMFLVSAWNVWKGVVRAKNVSVHPIMRRLAQYGEPEKVRAEMDSAVKDFWILRSGPLLVVPQWLFYQTAFNLNIIATKDLMWMYKKCSSNQIGLIPAGNTYEAIFYLRSGKNLKVAAADKAVDQILNAVYSIAPWVVAGFAYESKTMWERKRGEFIATVDKRREELIKQPAMQQESAAQEIPLSQEEKYECRECGKEPEKGYEYLLCPACRSRLAARKLPAGIKAAAGVIFLLLAVSLSGLPPVLNAAVDFERGRRAEARNDYLAAKDAYQKVVERFGKHVPSLSRLAVSACYAGDAETADKAFSKLEGLKISQDLARELYAALDKLNALNGQEQP